MRKWRRDGYHLPVVHMGAPPDWSRDDGETCATEWSQPAEDIFEEGCPAAWVRTAFLQSLLRYRRRPTEGGGRTANTLLDRCADEWIHDAIAELERWEDAWFQEHRDAALERIKKKGAGHG